MEDEENNLLKETVEALNVTGVVPELYQDALSPAAKEVGKGLKTVAQAANLALRPVAALVWGYDKIESYVINTLPSKLKGKKDKDIVTPQTNIAGPLLESLRYTGYQEELREMYINLLATSMDKENASKAHPAFVEIIRQLSPDEARILAHIQLLPSYPHIQSDWIIHSWISHTLFQGLIFSFKELCQDAGVQHLDLYQSYLDNLRRLQLLEFRQDIGEFKINELYDDMHIESDRTESLGVTDLGCQFIEACIGKIDENERHERESPSNKNQYEEDFQN